MRLKINTKDLLTLSGTLSRLVKIKKLIVRRKLLMLNAKSYVLNKI
jgi:hypothetical protein